MQGSSRKLRAGTASARSFLVFDRLRFVYTLNLLLSTRGPYFSSPPPYLLRLSSSRPLLSQPHLPLKNRSSLCPLLPRTSAIAWRGIIWHVLRTRWRALHLLGRGGSTHFRGTRVIALMHGAVPACIRSLFLSISSFFTLMVSPCGPSVCFFGGMFLFFLYYAEDWLADQLIA